MVITHLSTYLHRQQCDEYGVRSQQLWAKAKADGIFDCTYTCSFLPTYLPTSSFVFSPRNANDALYIILSIVYSIYLPSYLPTYIHTAEIAPVEVKTKKGLELVTTDEHPRPQVELAKISKLPPVFKKEG